MSVPSRPSCPPKLRSPCSCLVSAPPSWALCVRRAISSSLSLSPSLSPYFGDPNFGRANNRDLVTRKRTECYNQQKPPKIGRQLFSLALGKGLAKKPNQTSKSGWLGVHISAWFSVSARFISSAAGRPSARPHRRRLRSYTDFCFLIIVVRPVRGGAEPCLAAVP